MKKRRWFVLAAAAAMCLAGLFMTTAYAQSAPQEETETVNGLSVDIIWGGSMQLRVGRDTPVTVRVESTGPEIRGSAFAYVPTDSDTYYTLEKELCVAAGETKQAVLSIPVDYSASTVRIEFRGEDGTLYAARTLSIRPSYSSQEIYLGAVSANLKELAVFDQVLINEYQGIATRLFDFQADSFPSEEEALKVYDVILWDGVDTTIFTEEQMNALKDWVYDGGTLITGNDSDLCGRVAEDGIERECWGKGQFVYCGFSLQEAAQRYPDETEIRDFLREAVGSSRISAIEDSINYSYDDYWNARDMTFSVDPRRVPQVWQYALILGIYLVILGPVLYTALKKKERQDMLRGTMVAIALLFAGIVYLCGSQTRFTRPFMNYAAIREMRDASSMETVFTNICSPYNAAYSFTVNEAYSLTPISSYEMNGGDIGEGTCEMHICYQEDGSTRVQISKDIPFTARLFHLSRTENHSDTQGFEGEISLFDAKASGCLINATGYDMERVCVLMGGRLYVIGSMKAGEEADLSKAECVMGSSYEYEEALRILSGLKLYQDVDKSQEHAMASWRNQIVSYYINNMMPDEKQNAVVLAFPAEEDVTVLKEDDADVRGATLVTAMLPVDMTHNGQIYSPVWEKEPTAVQGSYDLERNSVYTKVSVIQYDFGSLSVDCLIPEWPDPQLQDDYSHVFRGTMEFYNWRTRTYDRMDGQERMMREELADYLDENNRLVIRYEADIMEDYIYELLLPRIAAIGRKGQ